MGKDIWNTFHLEPGNPDEINLLGFDNGAGNCCVTIAGKGQNDTFSATEHLFFEGSHNVDNLFTAIAFSQTQIYLGREAGKNRGDRRKSEVYVNFKMPPDEASRQFYHGDAANPSYQTLMKRFFQSTLQVLFQCNDKLKKNPRTVLFVGRPASPRWQECEDAYRQLLSEGLQIDGYDGQIDIVIYSEAQAALAYEYSRGQIEEQETVLIIDCGSSTFDAVLVKGREIIAEYSRQLGAGQIEFLMLDEILSGGDASLLADVDTRLEMHREKCAQLTGMKGEGEILIELRGKKEIYFGPDGTDKDEQLQKLELADAPAPLKREIDEAFMARIIHGIPVRVMDSEPDESSTVPVFGETDYPSFADAAEAFLHGARARCQDAGCLPDRVILTGGASVMPFIGDLVCRVFGEDSFGKDRHGRPCRRSQNPQFSVAEGLAFMGYIEFLKENERLAQEQLVSGHMDSASGSILDCIRGVYLEAIWDSVEKDFEEWSTTDNLGSTVREGVSGRGFRAPPEAVAGEIQRLLNDKVISSIQQSLNARFQSLLPQLKRFSFSLKVDVVDQIIAATKPLQKVTFSKKALLGTFRSIFVRMNKPLPMSERRNICHTVLSHKADIRSELYTQLTQRADGAAKALTAALKQQLTEEVARHIASSTPYFVENFTVQSSGGSSYVENP